MKAKIKIEYFKSLTAEIVNSTNSLADIMDNFDVCADEDAIKNLAEALRYFAELIENIPIA